MFKMSPKRMQGRHPLSRSTHPLCPRLSTGPRPRTRFFYTHLGRRGAEFGDRGKERLAGAGAGARTTCEGTEDVVKIGEERVKTPPKGNSEESYEEYLGTPARTDRPDGPDRSDLG